MDLDAINDNADEVNELAKTLGVPYKVRISPELYELLKPNKFMAELGIQYSDRIKSILGVFKGNLIWKKKGREEAMPKDVIAFPLTFAKGPYIREEIITIKAELTDDAGTEGILLTAILEEE
jgi:hypothetical protein